MALSRVSLTLLAVVFVNTVVGQASYGGGQADDYALFYDPLEEQRACTYSYMRLTIALDEQTCVEACKNCKTVPLP